MVQTNFTNWVVSGILYSSYNSILLIPVLITLKDYLKKTKAISYVSLVTTAIIIVLSFIVFSLLIRVDVDITKLQMPAVYVVSNGYKMLKLAYGFVILASIFTTAISLGTSFLKNTSKNKKSYTQIAVMMCIIAIAVSQIGFSNLVNLLYPIFGYLGLVQIGKIILIKRKQKELKGNDKKNIAKKVKN